MTRERIVSDKTKRKISEANYQRYIKYPNLKKKISEALKGKKKSEETKKKMGEARKGNKNVLGKHWKVKDTSNMNKDKIGKKRPPFSEEHIKKMREATINNPNRKFKDTSIELKIEAELKRRNVNYQKQVPLCKVAIVDFYLPEFRIIIQADGDYWHNLPDHKERDEQQDKVLTFNGFNVYRFWEHEINKSVEKCINKLKLKYDK